MKSADHALLMTTTYTDLVSNLSIMESYREIFFRHWPDGQIPQKYLNWAGEKFNHAKNGKEEGLNAWIAKEASKFTSSSKDTKLKVYFGAQLIKEAHDAIAKIKQFHNRYFIAPDELPSGKSMSAMYKAMKKQLLKVYSQHSGYNTLGHKSEWKDKVSCNNYELYFFRP